MKEIILHHYPQSPVSEKVRVGLGLKDLEWASVEVPRLPPKPDLTALTGGYRRAPVMQIGADVFCDSHCILRELQRRFPEPSFTPNGAAGLCWGIGRWIDAEPFDMAVRLVLGAGAAELPREFLDDRSRLYFGPDRDLDAIQANLPHLTAQLRVHLGLIGESLADGRSFLFGDRPGLADIFCYYLVWFLRGRWAGGPALLAQFAALEAWETKVAALGHGRPVEASASEALEAARQTEPHAPRGVDPLDPLALNAGQRVTIRSAFDDGEAPVEGALRYANKNTIIIDHEDPYAGNIAVHFPRAGYRIMPIAVAIRHIP
jgi:glutathione S-transferase